MDVTNEAELDQALGEMQRLEAELGTINNNVNKLIDVIKLEGQRQAVTVVDGVLTLPIPERLAELDRASRAFCDANKAALLGSGKLKSREFTHGSIGWRAKKKSIVYTPAGDEARVSLVKRLINAVICCLAKLAVVGTGRKAIKADRLFNVSIDLNKTAVLDLFNKEQITATDLEGLGLAVAGGEDELWIKPAALVVTPHQGAAA